MTRAGLGVLGDEGADLAVPGVDGFDPACLALRAAKLAALGVHGLDPAALGDELV